MRHAAKRGSAGTVAHRASSRLSGRFVLVALFSFFGVVIGVNGVMIALAIGTMPGLENDRPYQTGVAYNAEIAAARAQATRYWTVAARVVRDPGGRTTVTVIAGDAAGTPIGGLTVVVKLLRPTDQRDDHLISLSERETGTYEGQTAGVPAGAWDVEIDAHRASERLFRSHNRIIVN
ncbi:MAG: FixH family protein [Alphaproteobacteria bacterium]|nr:FixH family protein [Alphaproteobacteria bacterium]